MSKIRVITLLILIAFISAFSLFLIRLFSERQLDDVSPEIFCEQALLEKADVLYIIPKFDNKSISENKEFCEKILALNKILALHGVYHSFNEFLISRNEEYLQEGIDIFYECFNLQPKEFKPPYLKISEKNKRMIKSKMKLDLSFNQMVHKVYHCNDSATPNWLVDLF